MGFDEHFKAHNSCGYALHKKCPCSEFLRSAFSALGLNSEIYRVNLFIQSEYTRENAEKHGNAGKYGPENTEYRYLSRSVPPSQESNKGNMNEVIFYRSIFLMQWMSKSNL